MIQVNELRINNILSLCGEPTNISAGFIADYDFSLKNNFSDNTPIRKGDVEPISLTEEWLFKFGFSQGFDWEEGNFTNTLDNSILLRFNNDENVFIVGKYLYSGFAGSFTKLTEVKTVHQLQNLYFSLTGTELTLKS